MQTFNRNSERNLGQQILDAEQRCKARIKALEDAWRLTNTYTCRYSPHEIREIKENFETELNKLSHAVDYLLEHTVVNYDTKACKEMISIMATGKRPFSGAALRRRKYCKSICNYCYIFMFGLCISIISFLLGIKTR